MPLGDGALMGAREWCPFRIIGILLLVAEYNPKPECTMTDKNPLPPTRNPGTRTGGGAPPTRNPGTKTGPRPAPRPGPK